MKCSICGTESKADAKQCERCGAALVVPTFDKTMLLDVRAFRAAQQSGEAPVIRPMAPSAAGTIPAVTPAMTSAVTPPATPLSVAARPRPSRIALVAVTIILGIVAYVVYQLAMTLYSAPAVRVVAPAASPSAPAPGRPNAAPAPAPAHPATGQ